MTTPLPVNIDTTYADSGTDASVAAHQQHHDRVHAFVNSGAATLTSTVRQRGRVARLPLVTRMQPVGQDGGLSTNTWLGATYRYRHVVQRSGTDLQLSFVNWKNNGSGIEGNGPNNITVRAAIEYPAGTFIPVFFGGKRDVVIEPGATVFCDPVGITLKAGDFVYSRTYVTVASAGQTWPTKMATIAGNGEGHNGSATPTDLTTSGTVPTVTGFGYHPAGCYVTPSDPTDNVAWALVGDSITNGVGYTGASLINDVGYAVTALGTVPWHKIAFSSEKASDITNQANKKRWALLAQCSHAIIMYGTNDLSGTNVLANIQASLLQIWTEVLYRGMKGYACTLTPRTTSTDGWVTTANQAVDPAGNNATRVSLNNWIRAGAPIDPGTKAAVAVGTAGALVAGVAGHPLAGWFEVADSVETARDSGIWKAGYTTDGLHPGDNGHPAMATALQNAGIRTLT